MSQECTNKMVMNIREGVIVTKEEKDNEKEESDSSMENVGVIEKTYHNFLWWRGKPYIQENQCKMFLVALQLTMRVA